MPKRIKNLRGVGSGPLQPAEVNMAVQIEREGKAPRIYGHPYTVSSTPIAVSGGGSSSASAPSPTPTGLTQSNGFAHIGAVDGLVTSLTGPAATSVTFTASPYAVGTIEDALEVDASGGVITINLITSSSAAGRLLQCIKTDASANVVTITPAGTDTIDGASSYTLSLQYQSVILYTDGSGAWYVWARYHAPSGVAAGSYTSANITVDIEGRVTAASNGSGGGGSSFLGMTLTPPVLTDWTAVNMPSNASASTDSVHGGIIIVQGTGTSSQPCLTKAQPSSTPYTIEVGYMMTGVFNSANTFVMIGWYDSGTGHLYGYVENKGSGNNHEYIQCTKFTNFSFSAASPNQFTFDQTFPQLRFARLYNDGTNLVVSISQDGVNYVQYFSTTQASSITPTHILLSATSADSTYGVAADFVHYHEH